MIIFIIKTVECTVSPHLQVPEALSQISAFIKMFWNHYDRETLNHIEHFLFCIYERGDKVSLSFSLTWLSQLVSLCLNLGYFFLLFDLIWSDPMIKPIINGIIYLLFFFFFNSRFILFIYTFKRIRISISLIYYLLNKSTLKWDF